MNNKTRPKVVYLPSHLADNPTEYMIYEISEEGLQKLMDEIPSTSSIYKIWVSAAEGTKPPEILIEYKKYVLYRNKSPRLEIKRMSIQ